MRGTGFPIGLDQSIGSLRPRIMTEESWHPFAFGTAILWRSTERNAIPLQPQFLHQSSGNSGVGRVESLRHSLPALLARGEQADETGSEESEGAGWGVPPGCMRPGGGMCGG